MYCPLTRLHKNGLIIVLVKIPKLWLLRYMPFYDVGVSESWAILDEHKSVVAEQSVGANENDLCSWYGQRLNLENEGRGIE